MNDTTDLNKKNVLAWKWTSMEDKTTAAPGQNKAQI